MFDALSAWRRRQTMRGMSLIELLVVLSIVAIVIGVAIPRTAAILHDAGVRGAAYYYRGLIRQVRRRAITERRYIGIVFTEKDGDVSFELFADGNGNGIRTQEMRRGIDTPYQPNWHYRNRFIGVRYGGAATLAGRFPPLRFGRGSILSFSPTGTATSGTLFLSNDQGNLYAAIVAGVTGRVRLVRYRAGKWEPV